MITIEECGKVNGRLKMHTIITTKERKSLVKLVKDVYKNPRNRRKLANEHRAYFNTIGNRCLYHLLAYCVRLNLKKPNTNMRDIITYINKIANNSKRYVVRCDDFIVKSYNSYECAVEICELENECSNGELFYIVSQT